MKPLAPLLPLIAHPVLAICVGASLGALLRWRLGLWLNHADGWMAWGTLAANLVGGLLIGIVLALAHHLDLAPVWRLAIITGFLGGLTTFSTFSLEVVTLLAQRQYGWGLGAAGLHLVGSLLMTALGMLIVNALFARA